MIVSVDGSFYRVSFFYDPLGKEPGKLAPNSSGPSRLAYCAIRKAKTLKNGRFFTYKKALVKSTAVFCDEEIHNSKAVARKQALQVAISKLKLTYRQRQMFWWQYLLQVNVLDERNKAKILNSIKSKRKRLYKALPQCISHDVLDNIDIRSALSVV